MELETDKALIGQIILLGREGRRGEAELRALIQRLGEDEQAELVAIMWIGRGAFEIDEWKEALSVAAHEATTPTDDYLIGTPHFTDHLEAGLEALGISSIAAEDAAL